MSGKQARWALLAILGLMLIAGSATAFTRPIWESHEADYLQVIRFWLDNGRLPEPEDYPNGDAEVRQATQPPLYFIAALPVVALIDDRAPAPPAFHPDAICPGADAVNSPQIAYPVDETYTFPPRGAVLAGYALRLLSLTFGLVTVIAVYAATRRFFPAQPVTAVIAAALMAFEPVTLRAFTLISNDALLIMIAAINLYLCAQALRTGRLIYAPLILLCGGAAVMARLPGWALLGVDVLFVLLWIASLVASAGRSISPRRLRLIGAVIAVMALLIVGLGAFNYAQYGSIFGRYEQLDQLVATAVRNLDLPLPTLIGVLDQTRLSYLEVLDQLSPRAAIRTVYTLMIAAGLALGVAAAVVALARRQGRAVFGLLLLTIGVTVALVVFRNTILSNADNTTFYSTAFIFAPIRYYAPALPALAVLIAAGFTLILPQRSPVIARAALATAAAGIAVIWLVVGLLSSVNTAASRPEVRQFPPETVAAMSSVIPAGRGDVDGPQIIGYQMFAQPSDGLVNMRLFARTNAPLDENYLLEFDWGAGLPCRVLPARGFAPTTMWPTDQVITFEVTVPYCAEAQADPTLSTRWRSEAGETPRQPLITLDGDFVPAAACPSTFGIIGDPATGYRPTQYVAPLTARIEEPYLPSIHWLVLGAEPDISLRQFTFTHEETGTRYTCESSEGAVSPLAWRSGTYIYFDQCPFRFPADAPLGAYTVGVSIIDQSGAYYPAWTSTGDALPEPIVPLTTITLQAN